MLPHSEGLKLKMLVFESFLVANLPLERTLNMPMKEHMCLMVVGSWQEERVAVLWGLPFKFLNSRW